MRFNVAEVQLGPNRAYASTHLDQLKRMISATPESVSKPMQGNIVATQAGNQLVWAVGMSFAQHFPLILSPDSIWLTIAQGLANHINRHAEDVRKRFVAHEGKAQIVIQRDEFIKGAQDNDWEGAFAEFSSKIKEHIGPANHEMIVADFSTTKATERAASEVVLMDAMQSYFEYGMMTCCGIPDIELLGTVEDWERVRHKVNGWTFDGAADLSWWTTPLKGVLDSFVAAAKGSVAKQWWNSFYKENSEGGSGAVTKVSGWINWLFPYTQNREKNLERNRKVGVSGLEFGDGLKESEYPSSLSKVPFEWNYYGQLFSMELLAGLSAVAQDKDSMAIRPNIGWAVREIAPVKKGKGKIDWKRGSDKPAKR